MLVGTRAELAKLHTISQIHTAHQRTVEWHQNAFSALMKDPAEIQFYWHLTLLAASTPPTQDQTRAHLRRLSQA